MMNEAGAKQIYDNFFYMRTQDILQFMMFSDVTEAYTAASKKTNCTGGGNKKSAVVISRPP